uniref:Uncharacterized protein n=1 Tax=Pipistrellus kuhlii TaxID=59472 RepID=A0A7J7YMQ3_PIPKU|nr:hypothetical protein mPipKuh1_010095 [Pipistrellus kuhlii]
MNERIPCRVPLLPKLEVPSNVSAMCSSDSVNHSPCVTCGCSGDTVPHPPPPWLLVLPEGRRWLQLLLTPPEHSELQQPGRFASLHLPVTWDCTAHSIHGVGLSHSFKPPSAPAQDFRTPVTKVSLSRT